MTRTSMDDAGFDYSEAFNRFDAAQIRTLMEGGKSRELFIQAALTALEQSELEADPHEFNRLVNKCQQLFPKENKIENFAQRFFGQSVETSFDNLPWMNGTQTINALKDKPAGSYLLRKRLVSGKSDQLVIAIKNGEGKVIQYVLTPARDGHYMFRKRPYSIGSFLEKFGDGLELRQIENPAKEFLRLPVLSQQETELTLTGKPLGTCMARRGSSTETKSSLVIAIVSQSGGRRKIIQKLMKPGSEAGKFIGYNNNNYTIDEAIEHYRKKYRPLSQDEMSAGLQEAANAEQILALKDKTADLELFDILVEEQLIHSIRYDDSSVLEGKIEKFLPLFFRGDFIDDALVDCIVGHKEDLKAYFNDTIEEPNLRQLIEALEEFDDLAIIDNLLKNARGKLTRISEQEIATKAQELESTASEGLSDDFFQRYEQLQREAAHRGISTPKIALTEEAVNRYLGEEAFDERAEGFSYQEAEAVVNKLDKLRHFSLSKPPDSQAIAQALIAHARSEKSLDSSEESSDLIERLVEFEGAQNRLNRAQELQEQANELFLNARMENRDRGE